MRFSVVTDSERSTMLAETNRWGERRLVTICEDAGTSASKSCIGPEPVEVRYAN